MTDVVPGPFRNEKALRRLKKRRAADARFRTYGLSAIALLRSDLVDTFPEVADDRLARQKLGDLVTRLAVLPTARSVSENPTRIGQATTITVPLNDDLDLYLKGAISRDGRMRVGEIDTVSEVGPSEVRSADSDSDGYGHRRDAYRIGKRLSGRASDSPTDRAARSRAECLRPTDSVDPGVEGNGPDFACASFQSFDEY